MPDIKTILDNHGVYWTDEGKNTQPGWININCPFCIDDDGNHGGFNIQSKKLYYNCWKCGWISVYDIFEKLKIPTLLIKGYRPIKPIRKNQILSSPLTIEVPGNSIPEKSHIKYLKKRHFNIDYIIQKYDIRFTTYLGKYIWRIIFPIYFNGKIVSYQGRDISDQQLLRYKACEMKNEIIHHKDILYNIDNCRSNKILLVEGIFDVLRIGNNCCCGFGTSMKMEQINLLKRYKQVFILFDSEEKAQKQAEKIAVILNSGGIYVELIQLDILNDPDEMTENEVIELKADLNLI